MDRFEAARHLGLADTEVLTVKDTDAGTAARVKDGSERLITDDGVYALTDHPATANLRRWDGSGAPAKALAEAAQPEQGEEKDDTSERAAAAAEKHEDSQVPDGNADAVLDWVGDDRDRAARALEAEKDRDNPRSTLISRLRKLAEPS